ncbi:MAG: DNA polymerase domain-containing protein, partial [Candidatus Nitrosopolaris sp.]
INKSQIRSDVDTHDSSRDTTVISGDVSQQTVPFFLEWQTDPSQNQVIRAASFVDSNSCKKAFLIDDYQTTFSQKAEYALLLEITNCLTNHPFSFGWYSKGFERYNDEKCRVDGKNSDLVILDKRLKANRIRSIVGFNRFGIPYIIGHNHIDAMKLYEKPMVKVGIYKNEYKSVGLEAVSRAILGRGKYKGYSGKDFDNLPTLQDKRNYVLEDSQLVYEILQHNDFEILRLMSEISKLTGINIEHVCNGGVSTLWTRILDDIILREISKINDLDAELKEDRILLLERYYNRDYNQSPPLQVEDEVSHILEHEGSEDKELLDEKTESKRELRQKNKDINFEGGKVIEPTRGEHRNVIVLDVASLYPTVIINYNISFDTIFCDCCKDDPLARVPKEVIDTKDYWICRKRQGVFTERMKYFTQERLRQKDLGNDIGSQGLKILINAGYGVFGYKHFKYFDLDVAILVAAYGRYTLTKMIELAQDEIFRVVYGDTDSIFIVKQDCTYIPAKEIENLTRKYAKILNIEVRHETTFDKMIIAKKKHYLGIVPDKNKEPIVKGFEGVKSDRVEWVRNVFAGLGYDYKNGIDPLPKIKKALLDLEQWSIIEPEKMLLKMSRLGKDPEDYENNCLQKRIGLELGLRRGDVINYYLADNEKGYSFDVNEASINQYRKMLLSAVKDILEILGYDVEHDLFCNDRDNSISLCDII